MYFSFKDESERERVRPPTRGAYAHLPPRPVKARTGACCSETAAHRSHSSAAVAASGNDFDFAFVAPPLSLWGHCCALHGGEARQRAACNTACTSGEARRRPAASCGTTAGRTSSRGAVCSKASPLGLAAVDARTHPTRTNAAAPMLCFCADRSSALTQLRSARALAVTRSIGMAASASRRVVRCRMSRRECCIRIRISDCLLLVRFEPWRPAVARSWAYARTADRRSGSGGRLTTSRTSCSSMNRHWHRQRTQQALAPPAHVTGTGTASACNRHWHRQRT